MSIEWMTRIWKYSQHKGSNLLMLLAIADYANESGKAFPGLETLATKTRQTKRNAIRIIEELEKSKELAIMKKASSYGTNLYQIKLTKKITPKEGGDNFGKDGDIPGNDGDNSSVEGGDNQVPQMSPNTSLSVSNDSLEEDDMSEDEPAPEIDPSVTPDRQRIFDLAMSELRTQISAAHWRGYFEPLTLQRVNGTWDILTPLQNLTWLRNKYVDGDLTRAMSAIAGQPVAVRFVIGSGGGK